MYTLCFGVVGYVTSIIGELTPGGSGYDIGTVHADNTTPINDPDGSCDGSPSPSGDCGCGY